MAPRASRARLDPAWESFFDALPDLVAFIDPKHRILRANKAMAERLGMPAPSCAGTECFRAVHGLDHPPDFCPHARMLRGGEREMEQVFEARLGGHLLVTTTPVFDGAGTLLGSVHVARDINALVKAEEDRRRSEARLSLASRAGRLGMWEYVPAAGELVVTDIWRDLIGIVPEPAAPGDPRPPWVALARPEDRERLEAALAAGGDAPDRPVEVEFRIEHPQRGEIWVTGPIHVVERDAAGAPLRLVGFHREITERKRMVAELQRLATIDPLTELDNRRSFLKRTSDEIERARRYGGSLVLAMLDIDHFKRINDTWGHPAGDDVLKALAATGLTVLRRNDLFGRIGGEEFAAALPETSLRKGYEACERLRAALALTTVTPGGKRGEIRFTVSVGVAPWLGPGDSLVELMKRADQALYDAKRKGRNRVVASGPADLAVRAPAGAGPGGAKPRA